MLSRPSHHGLCPCRSWMSCLLHLPLPLSSRKHTDTTTSACFWEVREGCLFSSPCLTFQSRKKYEVHFLNPFIDLSVVGILISGSSSSYWWRFLCMYFLMVYNCFESLNLWKVVLRFVKVLCKKTLSCPRFLKSICGKSDDEDVMLGSGASGHPTVIIISVRGVLCGYTKLEHPQMYSQSRLFYSSMASRTNRKKICSYSWCVLIRLHTKI